MYDFEFVQEIADRLKKSGICSVLFTYAVNTVS
jgi:hypothetical protein